MKRIRDISISSLNDFQLIFLGAPCHDADLAKPVKQFLDRLPMKPPFKLAGFFTHATYFPGETARTREIFQEWAGRCGPSFESASKSKHIEFLGYFHCQGTPSPPIEAFIRREIITSDDEWDEYLPEVRQHPNTDDLSAAKAFAQTTLKKTPKT